MSTTPRRRMSAANRREQLLEVGREVFAERGRDGATVEDLAARAGVTKPLIYEHFGGKDGMYEEVMRRAGADLISFISANAAAHDATPRARLRASIVGVMEFVTAQPSGFLLLHRDPASWYADGVLGELVAGLNAFAQENVEQMMDVVGAPHDGSEMYAQLIIGSMALPLEWWIAIGRHRYPPEEFTEAIFDLLWRGLSGINGPTRSMERQREIEHEAAPTPEA
ncbi:TetR/AcrR family transcriptional regulator [Calidifontibacter sp. DB0510]|uniref:TetR/AcrR family transcriptional regulator n=1 Tax=Metallococcus carri TaxID=1656884 RepID=A0A967E9X0_9MICO|nr:TetR/AcrR family transcriptional regulator [Metallococcus carri]NHN55665.1 TetR/AcrR family transcriptional regulator [Metallococcus carri]NOP38151.1 TetR/AcrR family transcriptional regulator [Calidifontibacter sp. DB2511S]